MSDQGPVCHVPSVNQPANPQAHDLPGIGSPAQPTLASLTHAVNDLQRAVRFLTGQLKPTNTNDGSNGFKSKEDKKKDDSRWSEAARVVETVRVFNPQDHDQYVDVKQINQLKMRDKVTGEQWTWDRDRK